jgi:hypothetical protein
MMAVNLVPLTSEEIQEIQSSVVDKMIELNKEFRNGRRNKHIAEEISNLSKLSEKISNYQRR